MTHTPGPWEWKDDDRDEFGHYRLAPGILLAHETDGTPWGDEIDQANARLIAAAPELLEACKQLEGEFGLALSKKTMESLHSARAAIAKATQQ